MTTLKEWIRIGKEKGASDLMLEAETPAVFRVRGELFPTGENVPSASVVEIAREALGPALWQEFLAQRSADLSKTLAGTRCRIHVFQTVRGVSLAVRLLSSFRNTLHDCNLNPDIKNFVEKKTGLLIVSGPTGSGKSTTLAAIVEEINVHQRKQIVVIENPVEYYFANRRSFIRQREVPSQTPSFEQAITDAMRENPDVLVIGEMRTPDVMRLTLNAAETGHLVIATMHSSTAAEALSRICMSFPAEIQSGIRAQLADCLVGVICQRLTFNPQLQLRIPLCEILTANSNARASVRAGQFGQLLSAIQTGGEDGMWSFERYQRWIDQKKDWVKPSQATALPLEEPSVAHAAPSPDLLARPQPQNPQKQAPGRTAGGRLEISIADDDLEALARKISESSDPTEGA